MSVSTSPPPDAGPLPSEGVRTAVSFLLVVHLSALAFIWLFEAGQPRPASLINRTYAQVFEPYGLNLGLAVPYDNLLITGGRSTAGSIVAVNVLTLGPEADPKTPTQLVYPDPAAPALPQNRHLQRMIDTAAGLLQMRDDTNSKIIMDLIAGTIVRDKRLGKFEMHVRAPVDYRSDNFDALREGIQKPERISEYFGNRYESLGRGIVTYERDSGYIYTDATQKMEAAPTVSPGTPPATNLPKNNGSPFLPPQ